MSILSDERVKNNIKEIDNGLEIVDQLRPVSFKYIGMDNTRFGFIAQEVENILPEIVTQAGYNGFIGDYTKSIEMESIIPYLVKAIQELKKEIEELKK